MTIHYGLIAAAKFKNFVAPPGINFTWADVTRDVIAYKMTSYFGDNAPIAFTNQLDYQFTTAADYSTWLDSTDLVPYYVQTVAVSALNGLTRIATVQSVLTDFEHNAITMVLLVKSYTGTVAANNLAEQKNLQKTVSVTTDPQFFGGYIELMKANTPLATIMSDLVAQKDGEGKI